MKKYCSLFLLFTLNFYFSQQTEGLRLIKEKYDLEIQKVKNIYLDEVLKVPLRKRAKITIKKDSDISSLELKREQEYQEEIKKIQSVYPISDANITSFKDSKVVYHPNYPDGMEAFKKEIIDHFNINAINGKGKLQSIVIFIIEKDGSIITAKGFGENQNFNKQAELAVLLIQKKWEPAIRNGQPERAYMSVPLTLNFD
ncbi:energy transducer TonB [Chryseobacterium viscerum]|uniref:TonB C-terminal domain-containing protein n=2 Tax=Chryseobacterium TaxID=59732 RepID=A0A316X2J2_9FLAO|nr:hypothetical protein [Chryseobacterium viscerum]KAB1231988.1 hypothetical protein F8D52_04955 [Chryseobacterium viscerum]PWN65498.1 hypothetical protein C1634_001790 [Chryseobacterium viscerum]